MRASREPDVAIGDGFILALQSLALHWWWPSAQQLRLPTVSSGSLAEGGTSAAPCLGPLRGMQSWGLAQLVDSSQKLRAIAIGTVCSQ